MGGMTCASALAHLNKKVLILEQHYVAGGMTHTFKRKGFVWDVGVHSIGEMEANRIPGRVFKWISDGNVNMVKYDEVYDTFNFPGGFKFELPSDQHQLRKNLVEKFPDEVEAIDTYIEYIKAAAKTTMQHFAARTLPYMAESLLAPFIKRKFNKWADRTTKEVLDSITSNDKLKAVLAGQWGYYGATPSKSSFFIHALTVRHFWDGGFYPEGTSKVIAENVLDSVTKNGGEVRVRASVSKLLMDGDTVIGVETEKGDKFYAPIVISAIGAKATVEHLVPDKFQSDSWVKEIKSLVQTPCHLNLYLGFEGDVMKAGATKSSQWFFETWDMEKALWDVLDPDSEAACLYASFASTKDPAHDPGEKMKHTGEVITFVPWEVFAKWDETTVRKRPEEYNKLKEDIKARMMAQMTKHMPELMKLCVYSELSTPLSMTYYCRPPQGAIYGIDPTPKRWRSQSLRPKTPIKGLYMTGGDIGTLGLGGAMMGGIITANKIDSRVMEKVK